MTDMTPDRFNIV